MEGLRARFSFSSPKDTPPVMVVNNPNQEDLPIAKELVADGADDDGVRVDTI